MKIRSFTYKSLLHNLKIEPSLPNIKKITVNVGKSDQSTTVPLQLLLVTEFPRLYSKFGTQFTVSKSDNCSLFVTNTSDQDIQIPLDGASSTLEIMKKITSGINGMAEKIETPDNKEIN